MSSVATAVAAIDPREFRNVLGCFPTGVVVVTAIVDDQPVGMVVGSFTSASLDPPLVAYLPAKNSSSYAQLKRATTFCINVLSAEQETLCRQFASKQGDKFAGVSWRYSPAGVPILEDGVAWIECQAESSMDAGDHDIVLGRVTALASQTQESPLLFFQGGYGGFHSKSLVAPFSQDLSSQLAIADVARAPMERLVADLGVPCYAQTVVAGELVVIAESGVGSGVGSHIGRRIPFLPPYGPLFLMHLSEDDAVRAWQKSLIPPVAERSRDALREMLARVRERGYSIGTQAPEHAAIWAQIDAFTSRTATPAVERELGSLLSEIISFYEPEELPAQGNDIRILSAPVIQDGRTTLTLNLYGFPEGVDREEVTAWRERLVRCADEVSGILLK